MPLLDAIKRYFDRSIAIARRAGIPDHRIVLDPGIGFGKDVDDNLAILNRIDEIVALGFPVLVGTSRKRFIGHLTGKDVTRPARGQHRLERACRGEGRGHRPRARCRGPSRCAQGGGRDLRRKGRVAMTVQGEAGRFVRAYLALGSNLGDRAARLRAGIDGLAADPGVRMVNVSPFYETPPWGPIPQGAYLNACAEIETNLPPRALLDLCLAVERVEGRERLERWGPRTLDIDILTYGEEEIDEPDLKVPHPRMAERAFVLVPLAAIAPALTLGGRPIAEILAGLDTSGIVRWAPPPG